MHLRRTCFVLFALCGCASRVAAQSWIVVPVVVGSSEDADLSGSRAHAAVSSELARNVRVLDAKRARERFETRGSSAAVAATHSDIDQLARDAQQALYHVAMGLYTSASADVQRVLERADRALESLNRESHAARQLLDSCLFIVRARLQEKKGRLAREQALECRRLVPDIEPDPSMHPAEVIGELAAAEAEVDSRRPASLRVTSDPNGCAAFVQGRNLGVTPLELPRLSPGEYRIQAECVPGEYGRVHRVNLGQSRAVVHVDAHLDAAVQTGSGISLRYGTAAASSRLAVPHAIEVGRVVGAQRIALIVPEPTSEGWVRISAIEVENGKLIAQVLTQVTDTGEVAHLGEALASLRAGRSRDFGGVRPAPLAISQAGAAPAAASSSFSPTATPGSAAVTAASDDNSEPGGGPGAAVWTIAAVGAATHVAGWVLYARLLGLEADYRKVSDLSDTGEAERRRSRIDDFELIPPLVAAGGAVLGTAALPWLLPSSEARDVPGWALGVGGGGVALAVVSAVLMIRGTSCENYDPLARCDDVLTTSHLGTMLLGSALPLLSVPVIYFARSLGADAKPELSFVVSHEHASLHWRGTL
jgi:hypothetical protein